MLVLPGIAETRVLEQRLIGQGLEECQQVLLSCELRSILAINPLLYGFSPPIPPIRAALDHSTTVGVRVDHLLQGGDTAVMHIRPGDLDIAQARRAKRPHVLGLALLS